MRLHRLKTPLLEYVLLAALCRYLSQDFSAACAAVLLCLGSSSYRAVGAGLSFVAEQIFAT